MLPLQINPVIQRIWVVCAACWPLAWIAFMNLSPGEAPLPPAPGTTRVSASFASPPVDTIGSQGLDTVASQGMMSTSDGVRMFWSVPEPGKLEARMEIDPGVFTDDPLAFGPEDSDDN